MDLDMWILEGKTPKNVSWDDYLAFCRERGDKQMWRQVARTEKGDVMISTVFLTIDHSFGREGSPILFETMIFGGEHNEYQDRYSTWDEAEAGHKKACELAGVPYESSAASRREEPK